MVIYQNLLFDYLRTVAMNPKNCPDNKWGLYLFLTTTQH